MTTAALPSLSEAEFMDQVTKLAKIYHWQWAHFRPAQTSRGWRTPVSGPLGAGWPDLVLVREKDRRLLFVELKRDGGKLSADQERVISTLKRLENSGETCPVPDADLPPWIQVRVWRPADFDEIVETLR